MDRCPAAPLHDRVIAELARQGRTKTWLHQHSGVARNTLDNWARQPRPPQIGTVLSVAAALGIDPEEAARLAGITAETVPAGADLASVDTDVLLAEVRRRIPE